MVSVLNGLNLIWFNLPALATAQPGGRRLGLFLCESSLLLCELSFFLGKSSFLLGTLAIGVALFDQLRVRRKGSPSGPMILRLSVLHPARNES